MEADEPEENDILVVDQHEARNASSRLQERGSDRGSDRGGRGQHLLPVVSVPESVAVGSPLVKLLAEDRDTGSNAIVTYHIVGETQSPSQASTHSHFKLSPSTGEIQVSALTFTFVLSSSLSNKFNVHFN